MDDKIFTLHIEALQEKGVYEVYVKSERFGDGKERFELKELYPGGRKKLESFDIDKPLAGIENVREFGDKLFGAVIKSSVKVAFVRFLVENSRTNRSGEFWLNLTKAPELEKIPWEALYFAETLSGLSIPIFRQINTPASAAENDLIIKDSPLRILATIASPKNLPSIDISRESNKLNRALEQLTAKKMVQLDFLENPTIHRLNEILRLTPESRPYQILYFIGYHSFDKRDKTGRLVLLNEKQQAANVSANEFGRVLGDYGNIKLLTLDAHRAGVGSPLNSVTSFARVLVDSGAVGSVIANPLPEKLVSRFATRLYENMQVGKVTDLRGELGRIQVDLKEGRADSRWVPAILYSNSQKSPAIKWDKRANFLKEGMELFDPGSDSKKEHQAIREKEFYFNLEGQAAQGNAVEFGKPVDLIFDYDVPSADALGVVISDKLEQARVENMDLGVTVIPVGFSFRRGKDNSHSRVAQFKDGRLIKKLRFGFRAVSKQDLTEKKVGEKSENAGREPKTGFHILFNIKGLLFSRLFLPVRLVDSIAEATESRSNRTPLRFNLNSLHEFNELAIQTKRRMQAALSEIR